MGITYQTSNRLRRKVQTAPLPALPEAGVAPQGAAAKRGRRWVAPTLLALVASGVGAFAYWLN